MDIDARIIHHSSGKYVNKTRDGVLVIISYVNAGCNGLPYLLYLPSLP